MYWTAKVWLLVTYQTSYKHLYRAYQCLLRENLSIYTCVGVLRKGNLRNVNSSSSTDIFITPQLKMLWIGQRSKAEPSWWVHSKATSRNFTIMWNLLNFQCSALTISPQSTAFWHSIQSTGSYESYVDRQEGSITCRRYRDKLKFGNLPTEANRARGLDAFILCWASEYIGFTLKMPVNRGSVFTTVR